MQALEARGATDAPGLACATLLQVPINPDTSASVHKSAGTGSEG
jgi:hypothetical protein